MAVGTHWAAGVQAVGTLLGGLGFVFAGVTAAIALFRYRIAERVRNAELAADILKRWQGPELYESRSFVNGYATRQELKEAYLKAYEAASREFHIFELELAFFEELGVMWKLRGVKLVWVRETIGSVVCNRWDIRKPAITDARLIYDQPTAYVNFQKLAERLKST